MNGEHEAVKVKTEPIWYPWQRAIRTALQVTIAFLVGLGGSVALLQAVAPQVLAAVVDVLPPSAYAWLVGAFAFVIAIATTLSKLMAIPVINAWLTRLGAGSVPRAIAKEQAAASSTELQPATHEPTTVDFRAEQGD